MLAKKSIRYIKVKSFTRFCSLSPQWIWDSANPLPVGKQAEIQLTIHKENEILRSHSAQPGERLIIQEPQRPINKPIPNSYCGSCGTSFTNLEWPRKCECCGNITYQNPIPVAVGLLPFEINGDIGLLLVKRAIKPFIGEYAFPGGFVDWEESYKKTISREIMEETCIETDPNEFRHNSTHSTPDGKRILIFGHTKNVRSLKDMKDFRPNNEVSELIIGTSQTPLCFSIHQSVFDDFFVNKHKYLTE